MADPDAWDAEDFEPELPPRQTSDDKWEGEDEDDGVKVNWEDSDDGDSGAKQDSGTESQAYQRPKKKPIGERLAEKEAQSKKEEEQKGKQKEEKKAMTAEEKQAEKERLKKLKEQESLSLARGLFDEGNTSLDQMTPLSESEFDQFGEALKNKIQFFEESQHYSAFVLQLINDLSLTLGVEEVKKLGININSVYHEKERQRKEAEKKKKKKSKASIKVDRADDLDLIGDAAGGTYYDDEDFI